MSLKTESCSSKTIITSSNPVLETFYLNVLVFHDINKILTLFGE